MWQVFEPRYGNAPDLPTTNPDYWLFVDMWPTDFGYGARLMFTQGASGQTNTTPLGAFSEVCPDGTRRWWTGTATKLYEWNGSASSPTVTDRSGTSYGATTAATWSFAQYGASTLAVNPINTLQFQTQGGAANFANADATAPKGNIVVVGGPSSIPLAVVFGYNDGTATPDGWYASPTPIGTAWTTSIAANIAKARLLNPTGPITAAIPYRDGFVAFKADSMWLGQYDSRFILSWVCISHEVGCVGKNAVCAVQDKIYFVNRRGFYVFDGSYPRLIDGYVHSRWGDLFSVQSLNGDFVYAKYDKDFAIVTFWASKQQNGNPYIANYYNVHTSKWTEGSTTITDGEPSVLCTFREGFNYAGFPCAVPSAPGVSPVVATGAFTSPVFGQPGRGVTLRGIWPQFTYRQRYSNPMGPSANVKWVADGTMSATSYQDSKNTLATGSPFTVTAQTQKATGMISGPFVQVDIGRILNASGSTQYVFDKIALDLEPGGAT